MMSLEQRIKKYEESVRILEEASSLIFEAGGVYEEVSEDKSLSRFYLIRETIAHKQADINAKIKEIRIKG